jgi:uncharacterized protein (TIGR00375 family)
MRFIADLHVHSRFSRATSKTLDLESLYMSARLKGIDLLGTGDFTHPGWFAELKEKLVPAEPGLFRLREDIERSCEERLAVKLPGRVRFMLVCEISNIYKKNERVRKNHNLVFVPDLDTCERLNHRLAQVGNISSDGRPILGLDARNLLEIVLDTSEAAFLIPAHIWTPWFSLLGSRSGFDSIGECFEDLSDHIFAVETGLSSDPAMNWMVSDLEGLTLVSNSDAHSAAKLGREANLFDTELDYFYIRKSLASPNSDGFLGTFEFFAEEGKYHFDGHRKCGVCFSPRQTAAVDGTCPVCGKPLTRGVLNRVVALADRQPDHRPAGARPYYSLIPLCDILSEIFRVGPNTKTVQKWYLQALSRLGSEFEILHSKKIEEIKKGGIPLLATAVERMRTGSIDISPGFDGEFGRIRIFEDHEREELMGQHSLFAKSGRGDIPRRKKRKKAYSPESYRPPVKRGAQTRSVSQPPPCGPVDPLGGLNAAQREAVLATDGCLLIVAGPGTGKTRTLTHKIAFFIENRKVSPQNILALTFTNRAAGEMHHRLRDLMHKDRSLPMVATFHAFCMQMLDHEKKNLIDEQEQLLWIKEAVQMLRSRKEVFPLGPAELQQVIAAAKQQILTPAEFSAENGENPKKQQAAEAYRLYQDILENQGLVDFEDLIFNFVRRLENDSAYRRQCSERFRYIFIDEYQDINHGQYRLVKILSRGIHHLCAIGDPNQSIYGFRGSKVAYFTRFIKDYPGAAVVRLTRNYRSTQTILDASGQVVKGYDLHVADIQNPSSDAQAGSAGSWKLESGIKGYPWIDVIEAATGRAEAVAVGKAIEEMVGGMSLHAIDSGKINRMNRVRQYGFSDFAVLYRTGQQGKTLSQVFTTAGIPHQVASRSSTLARPGIAEVISLLKVAEEKASLFDLERISRLHPAAQPLSRKSWFNFRNWCYGQRQPLQECLFRARRFPLPGFDKRQQRCLDEFIRDLEALQQRLSGMALREKLTFLLKGDTYPRLKALVDEDRDSRETVERLLAKADLKKKTFLADMALESDTDQFLSGVERVALMTMHAAKGLEFPVVFITGCENGFIPYHREGAAGDPLEERRLFYVAMTRAMERLFLTRAQRRRVHGKWETREPSPFLGDIEKGLRRHRKSVHREKPRPREIQLKLF